MKHKTLLKAFSLFLCLALLIGCFPLTAFADTAEEISMTEGDVLADFVPAGTACTSTDAAVAWVDENGSLNALKPGTVTVSDGQTETTVTVADYDDGSAVVGNLKLLARFNDSMQFYDGHVYLLFTSYQDGVEVRVDDLYAGYEISDSYYADIRQDIANGSNHTGNITDDYFTFSKKMKSVTLDRGELVTIGMYRDFDMSVPQAALGSVKNSSLWNDLSAAGKTAVIEALFKLMETGKVSPEEAMARFREVLGDEDLDYNKLIDGVVEGGVCFNRELYNQKLEWDQYENVTYDMDITANQLQTLVANLGGNLNKFSILKNSCATVALRAWNAAVGTRNGADTAYKLSSSGSGILSIIDAPKGVRQSMENRLPGCYVNSAEGVAEPGAGYQDDTGWVYVSAPKAVAPVTYVYAETPVQVDESKTELTKLINIAKAGAGIAYNKDAQEIGVRVDSKQEDDVTTVDFIDFTINGQVVSVHRYKVPPEGVWFTMPVEAAAGTDYYVTDAEGRVLPSEYYAEEGKVSFCADNLPVSVKVVGSTEGAQNLLRTTIVNGDKAETEIYYLDGGNKVALGAAETVKADTVIYVKPMMKPDAVDYVPADITLNGYSCLDSRNYDAEQAAYRVEMPSSYANLTVIYDKAVVRALTDNNVQVFVGDTLEISDYAELAVGRNERLSDAIIWKTLYNGDNVVSIDGGTVKAEKEGAAVLWACAQDNPVIGVPFNVEVFSSRDDVAEIRFNDNSTDSFALTAQLGEWNSTVSKSGTFVKKGAVIGIAPLYTDSKALYTVVCNGAPVRCGETMVADKDLDIRVTFAKALVTNMPKEVKLAAAGDTYPLSAKVAYDGLRRIFTPYDTTLTYTSSNPSLVTVDEAGLMQVNGEVPENGGVAIVTAYAGSSGNRVFAQTRVVVGDYQGDRIVGSVTISARPIVQAQLVAHGALTFTAYEDTDLNVSYYNYYKPNDKYIALMHDYELHPEKYTADPALYNDNELGIDDRESYFDAFHSGAGTPAQTLSLQGGESITLSNYGYESANLDNIVKALENSTISSSKDAQELVNQINNYKSGEGFDGVAAFDSFAATVAQIIRESRATGHNPADGHSEGGLDINREVYNQFRRSDSQLPNNYYTIEITADEFAMMEQYIANPDNNYYSLMDKNCATGSVDIWNATLSDKPELRLTGNYTGVAVEPESLYIELGLLGENADLDGEGGKDFYPRITAPCVPYLLGDADGDGNLSIRDVTAIQRVLAEAEPAGFDAAAADADGDGAVTVADATLIQRYLAEMPVGLPVGERFCPLQKR